jgi:hypothetical protein
MFPTFVTILPLTIPANYRLLSQFLSVGLKVGVRVWFKISVRFGFIIPTKSHLFKWKISTDSLCNVCKVEEDYDHFFMLCKYLDITIPL